MHEDLLKFGGCLGTAMRSKISLSANVDGALRSSHATT
jgi:hypothetical protein